MARSRGVEQHYGPSGGIITEVTEVNFKQGMLVDALNVELTKEGSIRRRRGMANITDANVNTIGGDYLVSPTAIGNAYGAFEWEGAANISNNDFTVLQVGSKLTFTRNSSTLAGGEAGSVNLTDYAIDGGETQVGRTRVSIASGLGKLFVANKYMEPIFIEFNIDTNKFDVTPIELKARDFVLVEESVTGYDRPTEMTAEHEYNLRNRGWGWRVECTTTKEAKDTVIDDPVRNMFTNYGKYPSLSDILPAFRTAYATEQEQLDDFNFFSVDAVIRISTVSGGGHYVYNAFDIDRATAVLNEANSSCDAPGEALESLHLWLSADGPGTAWPLPYGEGETDDGYTISPISTVSELSTLRRDVALTRPEHILFLNGHILYSSPVQWEPAIAGVTGLYFSQTLLTNDNIGMCMQEADPTAEDVNDVVATDGGFIPLPQVGRIVGLQEAFGGAVIFGSNGVFLLTGDGSGYGFSAIAHKLTKLTHIAPIGTSSIVLVNDTLMYFAKEGIIALTYDDISGIKVDNITRTTIHSLYIAIPESSRVTASGRYIWADKRVIWTYLNSSDISEALILDLDIGFFRYTFSEYVSGDPLVIATGELSSTETVDVEYNVTTTDGATVTMLSGEPVTVPGTEERTTTPGLVFYTLQDSGSGYGVSTASLSSSSFNDFSGASFRSYVDFAHMYMGDVHVSGQPIYVHSFFKKLVGDSDNTGGGGDTPYVCTTVADIVLVIDNTGSQRLDQYDTLVKPAITNMLEELEALGRDVTAGVVVLKDTSAAYVAAPLGSISAAINAVNLLPTPNGATNIGEPLLLAKNQLDTLGRDGVPGVVVLITDGGANRPETNAWYIAESDAEEVREAGYRLVVFGVLGNDLEGQEGGGVG